MFSKKVVTLGATFSFAISSLTATAQPATANTQEIEEITAEYSSTNLLGDRSPSGLYNEICTMDKKPVDPRTDTPEGCAEFYDHIVKTGRNDANIEYNFEALTSVPDVPTRETARRFYEWNPPKGPGTGSLIAAHVVNDINTYRYATDTHEKDFNLHGIPLTVPRSYVKEHGIPAKPTFYVASETSWVDALAAAVAANPHGPSSGVPGEVLLTDKDQLSPEVLEMIAKAEKQYRTEGKIVIVGGEEAVSRNVQERLLDTGWEVRRVGGRTRIETVAKINPIRDRSRPGNDGHTYIARGYAKPNEAESAAYIDAMNAPLGDPFYITTSDHLHEDVIKQIHDFAAKRQSVFEYAGRFDYHIIGGTEAISPQVEKDLMTLPNTGVDINKDPKEAPIDVSRIPGGTRFETSESMYRRTAQTEIKDARILVLVDGTDDEVFKVGMPVRSLSRTLLVQGDDIPAPTAQVLKEFGNPGRVMQPGNEHRMVMCYASEAACAKARQILYAK